MKALVLAAGRGSRLRNVGVPKPLVEVGGRPVFGHILAALRRAGIADVLVVIGHREALLRKRLLEIADGTGARLAFLSNPDPDKENGHSARLARDLIPGPFILLMADHLFDPEILLRLKEERIGDDAVILAVDFRLRGNDAVNLDDVTKILADERRITAIGKALPRYNGFDTGLFLCAPDLFPALDESANRGDTTLSGGVRLLAGRGRVRAMDIGARSWIDIDDRDDLRRARILFPGPS